MLVANRDPHHSGVHDISLRGSVSAPRFAQAMSVLQIVGTLLAIPVGLGSAYTMYRANFTPEVTCQSLRSNIVAMLDKSVDAATRHMLLRRDVEAFESACRSVDPDATAAFKALLVADKAAAPVKAANTKPAETRPPVAVKQTAAAPAVVKAEVPSAVHDASSDAVWVAAVRQALVNRPTETKPATEQVKAAAVTPAPVVEPMKPAAPTVTLTPPPAPPPLVQEIHPPVEPQSQPMTIAAPPPVAAPAPPLVIVPPPQADDGHPVPPAPIPEMAVVPAKPQEPTRSRLGEFAAKIPLVGWAINR